MHRYALRYTFNEEYREEGYLKEDAVDGKGLCDAIIGISIIYPKDGSYSQVIFSANGQTKKACTQKEIFKAWLMLGVSLYDQSELKGWQKDFVKLHAETIRQIMKEMQELPE